IIRLLKIKVQNNLTDEAFYEITEAVIVKPISLYLIKKKLSSLIPFKPMWTDMCINTCCAYTGDYSNFAECPYCKKERFYNNKHSEARHKFAYFPIIDHLIVQYQDAEQTKNLLYQSEYVSRPEFYHNEEIGNVFDGQRYKDLVQRGYFKEKYDIALLASIDGFQIFKQKTDDC
ncbi:hypothetical protein C2G38_1890302, partial [Gigaspora rosea]